MMNNFTFCNPVRIIYGKGACDQIVKQNLIPKDARVMLTYGGGSIMKNGVYNEVKQYVQPICEFGGIEANPTHQTMMKAVKMAKENNINFFLAVGGGSVIDGTKYVAMAMEHTHTNDPYDIFMLEGKFIPNPAKAKIGCVLTLPATGSEMNMGFVVSNTETHEKRGHLNPSVYPVFSVVDPTHTFSLPENQVRNGLIDSFVHVYEQYIGHYQKNPVVDAQAEGVMKVIMNVSQKTLQDKEDYQSRATFCYAATVALNYTLGVGIDQCWGAHQVGHELTAYYGVAHGESLAMTMPAVMRFNLAKNEKKLIQMGREVFGLKDPKPEDAILETEKFFKSLGAKVRLSEWGYGKEHFEAIATKFDARPQGVHKDINTEGCRKILELLF